MGASNRFDLHRKSSIVMRPSASLTAIFWASASSTSAAFDQNDIAHAQDSTGHALGVEVFELVAVFTNPQVNDGARSPSTDDVRAPSIESNWKMTPSLQPLVKQLALSPRLARSWRGDQQNAMRTHRGLNGFRIAHQFVVDGSTGGVQQNDVVPFVSCSVDGISANRRLRQQPVELQRGSSGSPWKAMTRSAPGGFTPCTTVCSCSTAAGRCIGGRHQTFRPSFFHRGQLAARGGFAELQAAQHTIVGTGSTHMGATHRPHQSTSLSCTMIISSPVSGFW